MKIYQQLDFSSLVFFLRFYDPGKYSMFLYDVYTVLQWPAGGGGAQLRVRHRTPGQLRHAGYHLHFLLPFQLRQGQPYRPYLLESCIGAQDVCIGLENGDSCLGGWMTFGNHVGDWEHVSLRLQVILSTLLILTVLTAGRAAPPALCRRPQFRRLVRLERGARNVLVPGGGAAPEVRLQPAGGKTPPA